MKKASLIILCLLFNLLNSQIVYDWLPISQTPNAIVYSIIEFQSKLISAGKFDFVVQLPVNKIAAWDGSNWTSLGKGVRGGNTTFGTFVYDTKVYNNELYVWGDFDSAGVVGARDIAKWNGSSWSNLGSGSDLSVYCTALYNNQLYAGGTFKNMGGTSSNFIAVWNGASWQPVGNNSLKGGFVNDLYEYQNELYAVGLIDSVNGNACNYIAKWNGTVWDTVAGGMKWFDMSQSAQLNQPNFVLMEWNGNLLVGSTCSSCNLNPSTDIYKWNGTQWSLFSSANDMNKIRRFYKHNAKLYCSGGYSPEAIKKSNVWEWSVVDNKWLSIGHGVNNSVRALGTYNGELYCGGNFNQSQGAYHNYMAKLGIVTNLETNLYESSPKVFPNPFNNILTLELLSENNSLRISNSFGQIVHHKKNIPTRYEIDLSFLLPGIYFLRIENGHISKNIKVVKE